MTLVGDTWRTVGNIDNSAARETTFLHEVLHDLVVGMRIDTQIGSTLCTPFDASLEYSVATTVGSQSVDDPIRCFIQPFAVFNVRISRIRPFDKTKCSYRYFLFVQAYVAMFRGNFLSNQFALRISVDPLVRIACRLHKVSGCIEDVH